MICELCKQRETDKNCSAMVYDSKGVTTADLCQVCMKKLKFGIRSKDPQHVAIYPQKEIEDKKGTSN